MALTRKVGISTSAENRPDSTPASASATSLAPAGLPDGLRRVGAFLLLITAGAAFINTKLAFPITGRFFWHQDFLWLVADGVLLLFLPRIRLRGLAVGTEAILRLPPAKPVLALSAIAAAAIAITYMASAGFHFSRDEMMADFDAVIFRSGHLIAPIAPEWRSVRAALVPDFLMPVPGDAGFASSYLPGNAAIRALVGLLVSPDWTSPILAGVAVLALFGIARRLWPDRPDAVVVSVLMLTTSPQVLITATTSYAMTAHLAVNLVWLWLFLRDDPIGHAGAIGIGFIGCGLHQVIFHPLFAAPFITYLWAHRRLGLGLVYTGAYAAMAAFWIVYPSLALSHSGMTGDLPQLAGFPDFAERASLLIDRFSVLLSTVLTIDNLLRFITWQHILILPLVIVSFGIVRRSDDWRRALAAGPLLTLIAIFILLPWQGYGWGFRYLHGLIGNFALLAGYGWLALTSDVSPNSVATGRSVLASATVFTAAVLLPARVVQVVSMEAPYRAAVQAIERAPTDLVLVDPSGMQFAKDLVRNDPFLRNRPRVLDLTLLRTVDTERLCSRLTVSLFDRRLGTALGIPSGPDYPGELATHLATQQNLMRKLRCGAALTVPAKVLSHD